MPGRKYINPGGGGTTGVIKRIYINKEISKTVGKKHPMDFYVGGENLGNYYQKNVIVAANQPFSPYFDASLVWGLVTGRMFYAGWRLKLK